MELTGAALRQSLPPAFAGGRRRRPPPTRVACAWGGFAEEGHLRYYEAVSARKAARARDLARVRAVGIVAGDFSAEKEATDLSKESNQLKEYITKQARKDEKAVMKALKKQKKAAAMTMICEDGSSSESSESDCEDEQVMKIGQGGMVMMSTPVASEVGAATGVSTECDKAAMKAMKKMEKEQKKAAKKAMKKMKKEAKKMAILNDCRDEDSSSSSSESSESECEGEVVRMSRCATIVAPQQPAPSTVLPIIVPQLPESVLPEPLQEPPAASAAQCTPSVEMAVVEKPMANRIEVCMGGKCKKSGAVALLQEFEKVVGTGGAAVGCKCLGKCGQGPNVRLRSEGLAADGSVKKNQLCIGVGLEDVGTIVTGLFGDGDLGVAPA